MARAMRASGDLNPKAMRVMSRILVFMDSMRPLESPCSMDARIAARCFTMLRCSFTNAGIRQRRAQLTHLSSASQAVKGHRDVPVGGQEISLRADS